MAPRSVSSIAFDVWNPALSVPAKEFDLSETEIARIKNGIETWDGYGAAADRRWLEPWLDAVFVG